jgi:Fe-S-cluster containining protein
VRRSTYYSREVPCPRCGKACRYLGYKIPVPPKRDERAWRELREQLQREKANAVEFFHLRRVRERHEFEKLLAKLQTRPSNPGRTRMIRKLKRQLGES